MTEKYSDAYNKIDLMTPKQAKKQLNTLGYKKLSDVPYSQSDYLMALFTIACSSTPLNLANVRDHARASMHGRGGKNM